MKIIVLLDESLSLLFTPSLFNFTNYTYYLTNETGRCFIFDNMQKVPSLDEYDEFSALLCEVVGADDVARINMDAIENLRHYLYNLKHEKVVQFLYLIDKEALKSFSSSLLEATLKNLDAVAFNRPTKSGRILVDILQFFTEHCEK
jgi:hypothetical protein